jgi:predicted nuclease with TOPRIM domain
MDTSRLEELLEQLIDKQDELISRIESLEATVEQQLTEANASISELQSSSSQIYDELNWWGEGHSLAKQVLAALDGIEIAANQY